jgi:hypothetical protein
MLLERSEGVAEAEFQQQEKRKEEVLWNHLKEN